MRINSMKQKNTKIGKPNRLRFTFGLPSVYHSKPCKSVNKY